jgi:hypothetical protein
MIGLLPDGTPGLAIYDEGGKPRIVLGATTFDVPRDTKIRKDGGKLLSTSSLAIFDENEKLMFQAP